MALIMLIACLAVFTACTDGGMGKVEITTSKSGKIDVGLYDQAAPADKKGETTQLTPLVGTTDKGVTDDGKGLYSIGTRIQGEGTLTLSKDKATEGETITFTATPATDWRFVSVTVNGEIVQNNGTSFTMPSSDADVVALFADMRHAVVVGDHIVADWGELRSDYYLSTAYTLVEGRRYEFTVDYQEDNHYYEDKDVTCRSKEGNRILATVTKVGDGRYAFVAPDSDCWVTVTTHEYRRIDDVKVFTSSYDWGIYSEQDHTDDFTVAITADGSSYTYGDLIKDGAEVRVELSSDLVFTVKEIYGDNNRFAHEKEGVSDIYDFTMDYNAKLLRIKIVLPEQYAVNCPQASNGTYTTDKKYAEEGNTVTVTATPSSDFVTASVKYTADGENYVKIPPSGQTDKYSFTMPASDVTIQVRFLQAWERGSVSINLNDDTGEHKVELNGEQYSYNTYAEDFIGETIVFRVIPNGDFFVTFETENGSEIKDLGGGYYSVVVPEENETVTVSFARAYNWTVRQVKGSAEGNYLNRCVVTGNVSGTHENENSFRVAEGEELRIYLQTKPGYTLFYLNISSFTTHVNYYSRDIQSYGTQFETFIYGVQGNSEGVEIYVSVK